MYTNKRSAQPPSGIKKDSTRIPAGRPTKEFLVQSIPTALRNGICLGGAVRPEPGLASTVLSDQTGNASGYDCLAKSQQLLGQAGETEALVGTTEGDSRVVFRLGCRWRDVGGDTAQ